MFEPARIMGTSATMIETLCVIPTAALLEETTKPLHRAILLNFWRHVHLEGAGDYKRIVAPDMTIDDFHQLASGADLRAIGTRSPTTTGSTTSRAVTPVVWPYDSRARLAGEHLYEDKTSLAIEIVDPPRRSPRRASGRSTGSSSRSSRPKRGDRFWTLE